MTLMAKVYMNGEVAHVRSRSLNLNSSILRSCKHVC